MSIDEPVESVATGDNRSRKDTGNLLKTGKPLRAQRFDCESHASRDGGSTQDSQNVHKIRCSAKLAARNKPAHEDHPWGALNKV